VVVANSDVNAALATILAEANENQKIAVGFDCEWPFDRVTKKAGKVSFLGIAFRDTVYIIKVSSAVVLSLGSNGMCSYMKSRRFP